MAVCPIWIRGGGWLQLGQHNLDDKCCGKDVCVDLKEKMGCVVHGGILDQYGIGVSLYFKFLSLLSSALFMISVIAIFPISIYW